MRYTTQIDHDLANSDKIDEMAMRLTKLENHIVTLDKTIIALTNKINGNY